jgi:glycopeptide antibiotics resistance protein
LSEFVSAAAALCGVPLIAFTMFPFPDFTGGYCEGGASNSNRQLTPFESMNDVTAYAQANRALPALTSEVLLQVLINFIFLLPLGFFLAYRSQCSLLATTLTAFTVSLGIEITQGTGPGGLVPCPYRLADIDDLMTNTAGSSARLSVASWRIRNRSDCLIQDRRASFARAWVYFSTPTRSCCWSRSSWLSQTFSACRLGPTILSSQFSVLSLVVSLALFVIVPAFRRDRGGPGVASRHMILVQSQDRQSPATQ